VPSLGLSDRPKFKVTANKIDYYTYKVVIATGSGVEGPGGHEDYHEVPEEVKKGVNLPVGQVMNLDQFIGLSRDQHAGKKVAILGPLAGTDAVMQAGTLGYPPANVYWMMRSQVKTVGFANVYPGENEQEKKKIKEIKDNSAQRIVAYQDKTLTLRGENDKVRVNCTLIVPKGNEEPSPVKESNFLVDYFVYATGQPARNVLTAPPQKEDIEKKARSFLAPDLRQELEPVYDINQRLGESGASSAPWQHVCGLQLGGTTSESGLMIIGAVAFQVADKMDHNFLQFQYRKALALLKQCSGFQERARATYPELLLDMSLGELPRLTAQECDAREKAFLLAWRTHLDEYLGNYVILNFIRIGSATGIVDEQLKEARQLCYLFKQRTLAAQYLYDELGRTREGMSVQGMLHAKHGLPRALQDCRLLAGVQANVSAMNAQMPSYLPKKTNVQEDDWHANFLENKTELRAYLAAHYPNIKDDQAQAFIQKVARQREAKGNMGFDRGELVVFEQELERLDREASTSSSWWPFG
jgi:hypothetical protein